MGPERDGERGAQGSVVRLSWGSSAHPAVGAAEQLRTVEH